MTSDPGDSAGDLGRPEAAKDAARAKRPRPGRKGPWALAALLAFLWGMSMLVFDAARTRWFEPRGTSHLVLVVPVFAIAALGAVLAVRAKRRGVSPLGGPAVHQFAIASGVLGFVALVLATWLGPRMIALEQDAKTLAARRQLEDLAAALSCYQRQHHVFPSGAGIRALEVLAPGCLDQLAPMDPWGHELHYRSLSAGRGYVLLSAGRDGVQDVPLADYVEAPQLALDGNDIVVLNGYLVAAGLAGDDGGPRTFTPGAAESAGEPPAGAGAGGGT